MVKDLEILKDIRPLLEKKIVIWGMGKNGSALLKEISDMRRQYVRGEIKRDEILLCDSDKKLQNSSIEGYQIFSPDMLFSYLSGRDPSDYIVCLTIADIHAQDEVLHAIEEMRMRSLTVYTLYAVKFGIYLNLNHECISDAYRTDKLLEYEKRRAESKQAIERMAIESEKRFIDGNSRMDELILIYQPGKVGSTSLRKSLEAYGKSVLHCHTLINADDEDDRLKKMMSQKSGKIISLVREPIARQISNMWQNLENIYRYRQGADFRDVESYYFGEDFENYEFKWFDEEIKKNFGIDIYEYPFDKNKGYCSIKKGNLELLLIKAEKLNDLEQVIGEFLHIDGFRLTNENIGNEKPYRFAYRDYKKEFSISENKLYQIYFDNKYMKHFYTEQEREEFYLKWRNRIEKEKETSV